jgi:hypothetical protein
MANNNAKSAAVDVHVDGTNEIMTPLHWLTHFVWFVELTVTHYAGFQDIFGLDSMTSKP